MRWFGFKTNGDAIQLSHGLRDPGAIDLRRRAINQAADLADGIDFQ